ncbi:DUF1846 domain-containing protein [bacterium]|nr:DUF1846 domain-containing protein [bacterium]
MPIEVGFDNEKYLKEQAEAIRERLEKFSNKLYLEFGGKIMYDMHASRVLPGFDPNVKMRLLQQMKNEADIILCIYSGDIARRKVRADFGITYDVDALKLIDDLKDWGIAVTAVIITRYEDQPAVRIFKNRLERQNIPVYKHYFTKGYPTEVDRIVSEEGYGANEYVETKNKLVIVTGPGPGSGKLATCLSQMYHDHIRGIESGYAKFETFPIWNIPLKHPVNVAYEAATVDLKDYNEIDPWHLEAYNEKTINYNRDVEIFPVLKRILEKITGAESIYKSPTDMGVNRAGFGIVKDEAVRQAAIQEIIRRYFRACCEYTLGMGDSESVQRAELIMKEVNAKPEDRLVVGAARKAAAEAPEKGKGHQGVYCGAAIELPDGSIETGTNKPLLHAASSLILNAAKKLSGVPDSIHLLSGNIIESISEFKEDIMQSKSASLDLDEALIALSISATTNPTAKTALEKLKELKGCEVHMTHIPTPGDEAGLRRLGLNLTSEPNISTRGFYEVSH